jgi:plastocyanin
LFIYHLNPEDFNGDKGRIFMGTPNVIKKIWVGAIIALTAMFVGGFAHAYHYPSHYYSLFPRGYQPTGFEYAEIRLGLSGYYQHVAGGGPSPVLPHYLTPIRPPSVLHPLPRQQFAVPQTTPSSQVLPPISTQPSFTPTHPSSQPSFIHPSTQPAQPQAPLTHPSFPTVEQSRVFINVWDGFFRPQNLTVRPGTAVTWINRGFYPQTVTASNTSFDSGTIMPGQSHTETFTIPGVYRYFSRHKPPTSASMIGTIRVTRPLPPPTVPQTARVIQDTQTYPDGADYYPQAAPFAVPPQESRASAAQPVPSKPDSAFAAPKTGPSVWVYGIPLLMAGTATILLFVSRRKESY